MTRSALKCPTTRPALPPDSQGRYPSTLASPLPAPLHAGLDAAPGAPSPLASPFVDPTPTVAGLARRLTDALLALLLAPACAACRQPLDRPSSGPVCTACWRAIPFLDPPVCDRCGEPAPAGAAGADRECLRCRETPGRIARSRAIGLYDGALRAIVHALKYDGRRSLARPLARLLERCGADVVAGADVAIPVPLHRAKRRRRGFNQADDLARGLPLPVRRPLVRLRDTPSQTDLPAEARRANVAGAFGLARGASVRGAVVVLVDDVSTTGATLEACARVLLDGGAKEVRALTAARVARTAR